MKYFRYDLCINGRKDAIRAYLADRFAPLGIRVDVIKDRNTNQDKIKRLTTGGSWSVQIRSTVDIYTVLVAWKRETEQGKLHTDPEKEEQYRLRFWPGMLMGFEIIKFSRKPTLPPGPGPNASELEVVQYLAQPVVLSELQRLMQENMRLIAKLNQGDR